MAHAALAALELNNYPIVEITSRAGLLDEDHEIADDLIHLSARKNQQHIPLLTEDIRNIFLDEMFNGWTTIWTPAKPDSPPPSEYIIDKSVGPRCDGFPTHLRMIVDSKTLTVRYHYYDTDGNGLGTHSGQASPYVAMDIQPSIKHLLAIWGKWNTVMVPRMRQYNLALTLYWARKRLLRRMVLRKNLE
ncbi:hypothetical protein DL546_002473 [Coniochaeta pulveracea]|uniref:Uncharacterized protein n=1 Tax=Coniochaeta pulveracea TaxID=177199 RepID=A0A420Y1P2_9PEZI|nr:hypothetical protein DL546_002473 [Coniochaeta pulveracea]